MNRFNKCIYAILLILTASSVGAEDYKEFKYSRSQTDYFNVSYDKQQLTISINSADSIINESFDNAYIMKTDRLTRPGMDQYFGTDSLYFNGHKLSLNNITDTRVNHTEDILSIRFLTTDNPGRLERFKKGNIISTATDIIVDEEQFVRGLVFTVKGDIEIYGEVNKDVISLFGNIKVAHDAVVRGDIATVSGKIEVSKKATVYGEMIDLNNRKGIRSHLFSRGDEEWRYGPSFNYNRIDGLYLGGFVSYSDIDSLLPRVNLDLGYAVESDRWRYNVNIEQTLLRDPNLSFGGGMYRKLASDDDWIIGNVENSVFALLFNEDYKDYYQAEGGHLYFKFNPVEYLHFEAGYEYFETDWQRAYRNLWSLFGGSKQFDYNFGSVEELYRGFAAEQIDTTANGLIYGIAEYNDIDKKNPHDYSGWHLLAKFEKSNEDFNSDYDYSRFLFSANRFQKISRYTQLKLKTTIGGSSGDLPMYKKYYLGGLGSLTGYKHKEYMGRKFWMVNSEYRVDFYRTEFALAVLWNVGRITDLDDYHDDNDIKHDLGLKLYVGDDLNLSLSKRLDRSYDDNPKFYVRFNHSF